MTDKMVTAWLDAETGKGTRRFVDIDMGISTAPTISLKRDRYRVCTMDFPADQQNMQTPFVDAIARAMVILMCLGPDISADPGIDLQRLHEGADRLIPEAFAETMLKGITVTQFEVLRKLVPELRINEEMIKC